MAGKRRRRLKKSEPVRPRPLSAYCPNLTDRNHTIRSKSTFRYNCIAWAAGCATERWGVGQGYAQPNGVPPAAGIEFLIAVFESLGFEECDDDDDGRLERGVEKVAIYADEDGWQHAARQKRNGRWTSKIGDFEDIEHDSPNDVAGGDYGNVVRFMKRAIGRNNRRKVN